MTARLSMLLALCCGVALAQTQSLTGTVTSAIDSTPIAGAKVTLRAGNSSVVVLTDAGGSFTFGSVPVGSYNLWAERAGYLAPEGQGQPGAAAFANVEAQRKPEPIVMRLTPAAALTGSVTDDAGLPLPNARVELIRRVVSGGRGRLVASGQTGGNDLGEFRMAGLAAGRYLVCADATASSYQRHHRLTYTMTCFPDVTDPLLAQWVNLGPGEERKLAFRLTPVQGIRVSGSVANAGKWTSLSIQPMDRHGFPRLMTQPAKWDEKTSSFEILALSPGDYLITANSNAGDGKSDRAMRFIHAGTEDVSDIRLTLREGPHLSGTVRMGDAPVPPENPAQSRVNGGFGDNLMSIYPNASGPFQWVIQEPGEYSVAVYPPPGWSLQSITQGGVDIRDREIVIGSDADPEPIEIVLGQGGGTIEVSSQNDSAKAGAPVKVILVRHLSDGNEWLEQGHPMFANGEGPLSLRNIPSGEYSLLACAPTLEIEYLNPEVLEKYRSFVQTVNVREGETTRVTVKPIPIE